MRYFILIIALFIATLSFSQGGKLIKIKVNKGETGNTGLTGPSGADGDDGREVELQNSGTYIQWRYVGDVSWTNLIDIVTITGADGSDGIDGADGTEIELQNSGTYIQWRYVGAGSWTNLIAISAITGSDGSDGADGVDGSTWYEGTGVPSGGLGANGDFYLNDANGDVYNKSGGAWSLVANIKGADGIGAGTVTVVTGSAPIVITSTATTTPNVTLDTTSATGAGTQYDLSLKENKLTGTAGQTLRFTGTNTVAASSFLYNNGSSIGINNTSPSGSLTVNGASYFNSQTPFNLYNASGTGIYTSFQDNASVDNLVFSGTRKTFTLGYTSGGGLSISDVLNKKLHVNGGLSVGEGIYNTAIDANSLIVEGSAIVQTRSGTATGLAGYDVNSKFANVTLGSGLSFSSGTLNYTNSAIQSLGGQTGSTQTFAYGQSGTTPSWSSGSNVHTFRLPTATIGQLMVHNGTDWTAATPAYENALTFNSPLSRSVNTISIPAATTSVSGHLTSTDWNTFNGKVGGSGATNKIPYWSNATTLTYTNHLHWDETNRRMGVNISTPTDRLTLSGFTGDDFIGLNNVLSTSNRTFKIIAGDYSGGRNGLSIYDTGSAATRFYLSNSGNVGIGNQDDVYKLSVEGTMQVKTRTGTPVLSAAFDGVGKLVEMAGLAPMGAGATDRLAYWSNPTTLTYSNFFVVDETNRRYGLNTTTLSDRLTVSGYTGDDYIGLNNVLSTSNRTFKLIAGDYSGGRNGFSIYDTGAAATRFYLSNSGNVGIANTSPNRTLEVTGEVRITDLTTDTPTSWVGSDGDGDLANGSVGNGIALASGALGLTGQALAVHNLASNGLIARTSSGNVSARTITAGNGISVTNGDGVSGNPTIAQSTKYASAWANSEIFSLTASVVKKLDIYSSFVSSGITIDETDNWLEISETGVYEVTITGQYESNDQTGNYYLGIYKYNGSETGIAGGVLLKDPVGYVPFAYTSMHTFTAGDNVYAGLYCSTGETDDTVHNYRINMKRLY